MQETRLNIDISSGALNLVKIERIASRVPHRARGLSFHSEPASEDHDEGEQPRMYMQRDQSQNRPIRNRIVKQLGFTRRPFDEPLTPGLRRQQTANAIGFTADITRDLVLINETAARRKRD